MAVVLAKEGTAKGFFPVREFRQLCRAPLMAFCDAALALAGLCVGS